LRGHGESARQSGETIDPKAFTEIDWLAAAQDIEAAHKALVQGRGVNAENVAAVGADVGANLLMHYALQHRQIQGVVLVSPGLDYAGIALEPTMEAYGNRPSMVVFTSGDAYAASSAQRLHQLAQGYAELREYQGSAHGINVFERSGHAADQILLWLQSIIGPPA
jgi:pimeloyl-ACP methyl ester carboxylesterase